MGHPQGIPWETKVPAPEQRIDHLRARRGILVEDIRSTEEALVGYKESLADLDKMIAEEEKVPEPLPNPEAKDAVPN